MTAGTIPDEPPEAHEIRCPNCGSTNLDLWDSRPERHYDAASDREYDFVVSYMERLTCGKPFIDDPHSIENIESDVDKYYRWC